MLRLPYLICWNFLLTGCFTKEQWPNFMYRKIFIATVCLLALC